MITVLICYSHWEGHRVAKKLRRKGHSFVAIGSTTTSEKHLAPALDHGAPTSGGADPRLRGDVRRTGGGLLPPGLWTSSPAAVRCSWPLWPPAPLRRSAPQCTGFGLPKRSADTGKCGEDKTLIHDFLKNVAFPGPPVEKVRSEKERPADRNDGK